MVESGRRWLAGALLLAGAGCAEGSDVAGRATSAASTSSGAGGGGAGAGSGVTTSSATTSSATTGGAVVEPPGPTKLTVVNGISDHDAILVCFLEHPDGTGAGVAPWPDGGSPLAFARARTIAPLEPTIPKDASVRAHVIAGDLGAIAGLDCAEILALAAEADAPVVAAALPVLPAQVFAEEKSLLLVPTGCLFGKGLSHPDTEEGCGDRSATVASASGDPTTAGLVAVAMSRLSTAGRVGFQVVHASAAMPTVHVWLIPGDDAAAGQVLVRNLIPGAIAPFPPSAGLSRFGLGTLERVLVQTVDPGTVRVVSSVSMSEILANGELSSHEINDGEAFVLVAVGAAPGADPTGFWHPLTYTLVRSDP